MQVVAILGRAARFDKDFECDWTCQPRLSIAATNLLLKIKQSNHEIYLNTGFAYYFPFRPKK